MIQTAEVYEQGTGKLIGTYEYEVPDEVPKTLAKEIEELKLRVAKLEGKVTL